MEMTRKEQKAKARELGIRCFNLMSREELSEAIAAKMSGNLERVGELEATARARFKKPAQATKNEAKNT